MFSDEEEGAMGQPLPFALFNLFTFAGILLFCQTFLSLFLILEM